MSCSPATRVPPSPSPCARADQDHELVFDESARRFESTLPSLSSIVGMRESMRILAGVGLPTVQDRILALTDQLADGLHVKGYNVLSSRRPAEGSALLAVRHPQIETGELHGQLSASKIACAVRGEALRISPHFYNEPSDIERLLDALPGVR